MKTAILDAAERRMQHGGFGGFSFREIAADVDIKSSSVHYHFPTKEDLAAAVVRRWRERASEKAQEAMRADPDPVRVWAGLFRGTAFSADRMCPCTVLAAASQDLPEQVASEVRGFFKTVRDTFVAGGLTPEDAAQTLSTLTGALVFANVLGDKTEFDRATDTLLKHRAASAGGAVSAKAKPSPVKSRKSSPKPRAA